MELIKEMHTKVLTHLDINLATENKFISRQTNGKFDIGFYAFCQVILNFHNLSQTPITYLFVYKT